MSMRKEVLNLGVAFVGIRKGIKIKEIQETCSFTSYYQLEKIDLEF